MMKRKKSVGKHKWTRTDAFLGGVAVVGGIIIGFMLSKPPILPVPVPLEGNYTTWTLIGESTDTGNKFANDVVFVTDDGDVYIEPIASVNLLFYNITLGLKVLDAPAVSGNNSDTGPFRGSVLRKYFASANTTTFKIWLKGTLIFSRDVILDEPTVNAIGLPPALSPNGKFIAVYIAADGNTTGKILLYEGS